MRVRDTVSLLEMCRESPSSTVSVRIPLEAGLLMRRTVRDVVAPEVHRVGGSVREFKGWLMSEFQVEVREVPARSLIPLLELIDRLERL
jgi:hypothetical protein